MAVWAAIKGVMSGAGRWVVIGVLVLAAIAIPGFGWWRARKALKSETARREAAERRAEVEAERARLEAETAEAQRRINSKLEAERVELARKRTEIIATRDEEKARIADLDADGVADEWNTHRRGEP